MNTDSALRQLANGEAIQIMDPAVPGQHRLAWGLAGAVATVILLFRLGAGAVIERGDGVAHYTIARWSWKHPGLLLDHWGKPLFTLLASPFAQLGHIGPALFNVIVALVTMLLSIRMVARYGRFGTLLYPLFLASASHYVLMVMAGMTEPLFGLLTIITIHFCLEERPNVAATIASLTPFSRPEFIAFVPCVILWLAYREQWKALPWLGAGTLVYALAGWLLLGDALWYLHNDPYGNGPSMYGHGDPWTFIRQLDDVTGRPLMVMAAAGLLAIPYLIVREGARRIAPLMLLCVLPTFLILVLHMYLWGKGIKGSAGILRVISTAVPMLALFASAVLALLFERLAIRQRYAARWLPAVVVTVAVWAFVDMSQRDLLPIPKNEDESALRRVAEHIVTELGPEEKLFTTHPFMGLVCDTDPYDTSRYEMAYGAPALRCMEQGDILFWDSELGPNESGLPFDRLWNDSALTLIAFDEPTRGHKVIRGVYYELFAFKRSPSRRAAVTDTLVNVDAVELTDAFELPPGNPGVLLEEFEVVCHAAPSGGAAQQLILVYEESDGGHVVRYRQEELEGGAEHIHLRMKPGTSAAARRLRFVDPHHRGATISGFRIVRHGWSQQLL